jgi:hypothetical protein
VLLCLESDVARFDVVKRVELTPHCAVVRQACKFIKVSTRAKWDIVIAYCPDTLCRTRRRNVVVLPNVVRGWRIQILLRQELFLRDEDTEPVMVVSSGDLHWHVRLACLVVPLGMNIQFRCRLLRGRHNKSPQ